MRSYLVLIVLAVALALIIAWSRVPDTSPIPVPEGTPPGIVVEPDGTIVDADGTRYRPDGTVERP